jgi:cysteinyl-tRNA synthetase
MPLYTTQKLKIYNSLSGEKETFVPIHEGIWYVYVQGQRFTAMYTLETCELLCHLTLYSDTYYLGIKVRYVRNITDVGHIVDDAEDGEDKIAKKHV